MSVRPLQALPNAGRRGGESFTVDSCTATLVKDTSRANAWLLLLDGVESSHVDLDDPTYLAFEYVRWIGDVLDIAAPASTPLDVVHIGGGGLSLPRYVSATRPMSRQVVFEVDAALIDLVRERLPWRKNPRLRVRIGDARTGLLTLRPDFADVVIRDAFADAVVPAPLQTVEFALQVKKILRPGGLYLLNVSDRAPFAGLGAELATLHEVFAELFVVSEPAILRGRRRGNLVVVASDRPLATEALARQLADGHAPARIRDWAQLRGLARQHACVRDPRIDGDAR